jgi:hypothetical protein
MVMKFPFEEEKIGSSTFVRTFKEDVLDDDLQWHYDKEDRIIECNEETDWMFQFDNELPIQIKGQIFIPKDKWHRLIKGTKDLSVVVKKEPS